MDRAIPSPDNSSMRGPFRSFCRILSRHSISGSVTGLRKDRAVDDRDETLLTTMMCTGHVRQAEWRGWIGSGRPKEGKTDQNQRWIKETIDDRVSYRGPVDIRPRGLAGGWFRVGVPQRVEALRRKTTRGKGAAKPEEKSKILYAPVETEESLDGNRSVVSVAAVDRGSGDRVNPLGRLLLTESSGACPSGGKAMRCSSIPLQCREDEGARQRRRQRRVYDISRKKLSPLPRSRVLDGGGTETDSGLRLARNAKSFSVGGGRWWRASQTACV